MEEQLVVLMDPWHDKYDRLLEAHDKLQKLNQDLEEKLLKLAENSHTESQRLSYQIHELTQRLVEARLYIHQLEDENDRYRSDINVVVQLLHCKPSNFVSPKLDALPDDLQRKVVSLRNGSNCKKEKKIIKVQVPTLPSADVMYSVDKGKGKKSSEKDIVSAAIMAKILQERENERKENRKNRCKCASKISLPLVDAQTMTPPSCTISYADFDFSDFDDEDEDDNVIDEEDEEEDIIYEKKTPTHFEKSKESNPIIPATIDDIMKTNQKEEELLPTPLFLRRNKEILMKHESQDSTYSTGSSNCNTTTNSSNSNISHSSRMSSSGAFEEEINFIGSGLSHPSPTSNSHSVSSASPDIQIGGQHHFFEDFDPEAIIQQGLNCQFSQTPSTLGLGPLSLQRNGNSSNTSGISHNISQTQTNYFNFETPPIPRKMPVAARPQSMNFGRGGYGAIGQSESHWRSTVLVHNPPKSHSYEPLSLTSTHQNVSTFTSSAKTTAFDSPCQEENPLLQCQSSRESSRDRDHHSNCHQPAQYYRAEKKAFWARSSSTASTETEI